MQQGNIEDVRALCTKKGFQAVQHLGLDKMKEMASYTCLSSGNGDDDPLVVFRSGLGAHGYWVKMHKVRSKWKVHHIATPYQ